MTYERDEVWKIATDAVSAALGRIAAGASMEEADEAGVDSVANALRDSMLARRAAALGDRPYPPAPTLRIEP